MQNYPLPKLTLVLGGVSSGKSTFAEGLVTSTGRARFYIATAQSFDGEMDAKIADHKTDRGPNWTTIEEPLDMGAALDQTQTDGAILLDCATMWLTNAMMAELDLDVAIDGFLAAISDASAPLVIVSNELGLGGVSDNAMARRFARAQWQLNSAIAAKADKVYLVAAGLPLEMK